ncbi:MAG: hypothetical protein ABIE07_01440 [Candidatus Zixiibacteriota bacterium]
MRVVSYHVRNDKYELRMIDQLIWQHPATGGLAHGDTSGFDLVMTFRGT